MSKDKIVFIMLTLLSVSIGLLVGAAIGYQSIKNDCLSIVDEQAYFIEYYCLNSQMYDTAINNYSRLINWTI